MEIRSSIELGVGSLSQWAQRAPEAILQFSPRSEILYWSRYTQEIDNFHIGYLICARFLMVERAKRKTLELPLSTKIVYQKHYFPYFDGLQRLVRLYAWLEKKILIPPPSPFNSSWTQRDLGELQWLTIKLTCSDSNCSCSSRCDVIVRANQCILSYLVSDIDLYVPYYTFFLCFCSC